MAHMKVCVICNGEIKTKYPSQAKTRKFCSPECSVIYSAEKRSTKVTLECITCGADFKVKKAHSPLRKNCSTKCGGIHKSRTNVGPAHWHWKEKKKPLKALTYKWVYKNGKKMYEHRYVMEQHLGRKLERNEHIHHINDNHLDNRIENLRIVSPAEHMKLHHKKGDLT